MAKTLLQHRFSGLLMRLLRRSIYRLRQLTLAVLAVAAASLLTGSHTPNELEQVLQEGKLTILSRNGPTTYYEGPHGLDGFEYSLAKEFADYLGVELVISEVEHLGSLLSAVGGKKGQLGAAGLTITEQRTQRVRFTRPYMQVTQPVVYRAGQQRPKTADDLIGKTILVISDSAHVETLKRLRQDHPRLRWHEQSNVEMIELIEMVHSGEIDLTIVDSNAYDLNRTLYPMARIAFDLSKPDSLAWAFAKSVDDSLFNEANTFLAQADNAGLIADIYDQHFGKMNNLDRSSALTFARRLETRLPRWHKHLKQAAEENGFDWQLLAAISYQESHWDPGARSFTGVRGLMMLTQATAREMGIKNRLDPEQSIHGGARYLRKLMDRIPSDISPDDRKWMALAAYNVGFGHLEDARVITERLGGDPDKWQDVEKHLPLLAKRKYYSTVKHGYARGWEPVSYVRNIRSFDNTIAWYQQIKQSRLASSRGEVLEPDEVSNNSNDQALAEPSTTLL